MRDPARLNPIPTLAERARAYFRSDLTRPAEFRLERLRALEAAIRAHEEKLFAALKEDLGKPLHEAYPAEIGVVYAEIHHTLRSLKKWMKPTRERVPFAFWPASGWRTFEPLGTALIIAPWNYPFQLAVAPVVGAIAAGCNVVLKPSELSPATSAVLESLLKQAFGEDGYLTVVQGGPDESTALLEEQWDVIFFTGSTRVGQLVMAAAAKHLTPSILELGGKSPCLVDEDTDLATTARRVAWGKCYNAGQTCVAPDYVLVHKNVKQAFIEQLGTAIKTFFGADPSQSPDYGRIVSPRHFKRLEAMLSGGRIVLGGQTDEAKRYIAPTVLVDVPLRHALMQEEIFGPLLPVLEVENLDAAVKFVRERPKPLSLYVFTRNSRRADDVLARTSSGAAIVNDTIIHVATALPFGGVGASGTGAYHGKASFDAFSHAKSVMKKPFLMDLKVRYPPYKTPLSVLRRLIG